MDNLWVLILLLVIGGAIVTIRLFRNGAREDAELAALETLAPAGAPAAAPSTASRTRASARAGAAAPAAADETATAATAPAPRATRSRRASSAAAPPAAWPGGDCPSCGSPTVPSAKFCGECGHRLIP